MSMEVYKESGLIWFRPCMAQARQQPQTILSVCGWMELREPDNILRLETPSTLVLGLLDRDDNNSIVTKGMLRFLAQH